MAAGVTSSAHNDVTLDSNYAEWASLPLPVVFSVLDKLLDVIDHLRFPAVCKEWCSLFKDYNHSTPRWLNNIPPMLLLIPSPYQETQRCLLYSVAEEKVYENFKCLGFPKIRTKSDIRYCYGAGHGWLAIAHYADSPSRTIITLWSPFRKENARKTTFPSPECCVRLPPLPYRLISLENMNIQDTEFARLIGLPKVILSDDPYLNPSNYVVVAFFNRYTRLAVFRAGDTNWTCVSLLCSITDATFYKGRVYVVCAIGSGVISFDPSNSHENQKIFVSSIIPLFDNDYANQSYIVKSSKGDCLLHVRRFVKPKKDVGKFMINKLVFNDNEDGVYSFMNHVELKGIGDEALFLGDNHSLSLSASDLPWCQPNSIYYTTDNSLDPFHSDMGIFSLENGNITQYYRQSSQEISEPSAVWITPPYNGLC